MLMDRKENLKRKSILCKEQMQCNNATISDKDTSKAQKVDK